MRFLSQWLRLDDTRTSPRAGSGARRSRRRGGGFLVEALEQRQLLTLTLTAAGRAAGFGLSTFATGFPVRSSDGVGPLGVVFPASGGVLVDDGLGNVRRFPSDTDGQNATMVPPVSGATYGRATAGLARVGANLYMMRTGLNQVVEINDDGTLKNVVATVPSALGVAINPLNGHLFVSSEFDRHVYDLDPVTGTATALLYLSADGLAFDPGAGILYAAAGGRAEGFNVTTKAMVFDSGPMTGGPDGIALGQGPVAGNLFVNTNGGTVVEVNLATSAQTLIASGGSRGDFVAVDPSNATLLLTQSDRITRLTPGVFVVPPHLVTTTTSLVVAPRISSFGQAVTVTAYIATDASGIPAGTVTFTIDGQAQAPVALAPVGNSDRASFTISSLLPGTHAITAAYSGDPDFASSNSISMSSTVNPPPPPAPVPRIIGEQVLMIRNRNKTGKKVGKPVLVGFTFQFNTAMNSTTTGLAANYQVFSTTIKRVKKKTVTTFQPVGTNVVYNASNESVTLLLQGKPNFAKGGLIKILDSPPGGVSGEGGLLLDPSDVQFTILPRATSIRLG